MYTDRSSTRIENENNAVRHAKKIPRVLIVDDDLDTALALEDIFRNLGCQASCVVDMQGAQRAIESGKADLIILDWMLGLEGTAEDLLEKTIRHIAKLDHLHKLTRHLPTKIVSYSSLDGEDINVPASPYFRHLDHWQKPIDYRSLVRKTLGLLGRIKA